MEFEDTLFHRIEVNRQILSNLLDWTLYIFLGHIWRYKKNFAVIQAGMKIRYRKISNHIIVK